MLMLSYVVNIYTYRLSVAVLAQACRTVCTFGAASVVAMSAVAMEELQQQMLMVLSSLVDNMQLMQQMRAQQQAQQEDYQQQIAALATRLEGQISEVAHEQVIQHGLIKQVWERLRNVQRWLNSFWAWATGF